MNCPRCKIGNISDFDMECVVCGAVFELVLKHVKERSINVCPFLSGERMCSEGKCGNEIYSPVMGKMCCIYCAYKESCNALCYTYKYKLKESIT